MNYYRRYIGDYHSKTLPLTPTDHGVYGLMLDFYYAEELPLPLDLDEIHAICRAARPEDRKAVDKVLGRYFERRADGYHNERADKEIQTSQQARINGRGHTGNGGGGATETVTHKRTGSGAEEQPKQGADRDILQPPSSNRQPPAASPQPPEGQKKQTARATRLPDAWQLDPELLAWALKDQPSWTAEHAQRVAAKFVDYWHAIPGAKGRKLDWSATWRNWVRSEGPHKGNGNGSRKPDLLEANKATGTTWSKRKAQEERDAEHGS